MAKRKLKRAATRGVPTLETVHEVREKMVIPQFMLVGINLDDYDPEDYDEDQDVDDYWRDCLHIAGVFHSEEAAIEGAKKQFGVYGTSYEWKVFEIGKTVKIKRAEPTIEVY